MEQNNGLGAVVIKENFVDNKIISDLLNNNEFVKDADTTTNKDNYRITTIYKPTHQMELAGLIHAALVELNKEYWKFDLTGIPDYDAPSLYSYEASKGGKFDTHLDIGPNHLSTRKLSYSIQLSDEKDYEGGDLNFIPHIDIPNIRKKGSLIAFPSFHAHCVTPITKGNRWAIVGWMHGNAFK